MEAIVHFAEDANCLFFSMRGNQRSLHIRLAFPVRYHWYIATIKTYCSPLMISFFYIRLHYNRSHDIERTRVYQDHCHIDGMLALK